MNIKDDIQRLFAARATGTLPDDTVHGCLVALTALSNSADCLGGADEERHVCERIARRQDRWSASQVEGLLRQQRKVAAEIGYLAAAGAAARVVAAAKVLRASDDDDCQAHSELYDALDELERLERQALGTGT